MKKIIISSLVILGIYSQSSFGQFKVNSYGRVGIGNVSSIDANYTATLSSSGNKNGLEIHNYNSSTSSNEGICINNYYGSSLSTYGIRIIPITPYNSLTTAATFGVFATGRGSSNYDYGILGALNSNATYAAGIYGSANSYIPFDRTGKFAGFFNGNVVVTGNVYGTLMTQVNSPSGRSVRIPLSTENTSDECVTGRLAKLEPVQVINERGRGEFTQNNEDSLKIDVYIPNYAIEEEGLKQAFPELVNEDADGNISVNYVEMVPLLIQSIKELKAEINELKGNDIKKTISRSAAVTSIEGTEADLFSVSQNEPNPFTESTTIKLSIPKKTQKAALMIYDMSGKQMKQININERGKTSVNITSEGLAAGMYLYSLIADGKVISTKRMILTK